MEKDQFSASLGKTTAITVFLICGEQNQIRVEGNDNWTYAAALFKSKENAQKAYEALKTAFKTKTLPTKSTIQSFFNTAIKPYRD